MRLGLAHALHVRQLEAGRAMLHQHLSKQARVAVSHAFDSTFKADLATLLPTGIYTIHEASMVGETEASLREKGIDFIAGRARYADLPRGEIIGDRTGFLKLLFRREDMRLVGVHVIGEQATELIHIGLIAMLAGAGGHQRSGPAQDRAASAP